MSCGYDGKHFGATYIDAMCIDGYLWDLDSCDEPGGPLHNGGDIPCPSCNTDEYVEYCAPDVWSGGNSRQRRRSRRAQLRAVKANVLKRLAAAGSTR